MYSRSFGLKHIPIFSKETQTYHCAKVDQIILALLIKLFVIEHLLCQIKATLYVRRVRGVDQSPDKSALQETC